MIQLAWEGKEDLDAMAMITCPNCASLYSDLKHSICPSCKFNNTVAQPASVKPAEPPTVKLSESSSAKIDNLSWGMGDLRLISAVFGYLVSLILLVTALGALAESTQTSSSDSSSQLERQIDSTVRGVKTASFLSYLWQSTMTGLVSTLILTAGR